MDCNVYVIVNNLIPYHKALPIGKTNDNNNTNDYSSWKYNLAPTYGVIKTGTNKITSKLACQKNNADSNNSSTPLTKFYSVNITETPKTTTTTNQQEQPLKNSTNSSSTATRNFTNNNIGSTVKKQTAPLSINNTKTNRISSAGENKPTTSNVTAQAGNQSQQSNRPSQSTTSTATLLSTKGIMSPSSTKVNTLTSGSTNSNADHGHEKSVVSGATSSGPKTYNHDIFGKNSVSRTHLSGSTVNKPVNSKNVITSSQLSDHATPHQNNGSVRVYIPGSDHINTNTTTATTTSSHVVIPDTKTNSKKNPVNQKPQLPNSYDKIPFVIATPLHHITNGTTSPGSGQPVSVTLALNLVGKMRVIGSG